MSRILIVEDDDLVRAMISRSLAKTEHEIREACNGKEALKIAADFIPDLVLTDILMPETDGFELVPGLRSKYPTLKIIACSGGGRLSAKDVLRTAKLLGADQVLPKPFSISDLQNAIAGLLKT